MSLINTQIPPFKATAYHNGKFVPVTEQSFKGKWSVVIFYPADFTFVCPTELEDLADHYAEFQKLGVEIYGVSTDTHFTHKAWHDTSDAIEKVQYPLVGDPTHQLTRNFDVLITEGEDRPGAARHLRHRPGRHHQDDRSARQRHRPRRHGNAAQAQGRPVRRRAPGRGLPGQVERRRQDPDAVAGPGRQDLSCITALPPRPRQEARVRRAAPRAFSIPSEPHERGNCTCSTPT